MVVKKRSDKEIWKVRLVNGFGVTGYFFTVLQWLMVFALYFTWIYTYFIDPMQPESKPEAPIAPSVPLSDAPEPLSPLTIGFLILIVAVFIGITIIAMIRLPKAISSASRKSVHVVAKKAAPLALQIAHKPKTKKQIKIMNAKLVAVLKGVAVILPVGLAWLTYFIGDQQLLELDIAVTASLVLAAPTLFFFAAQYIWAWTFRIPLEKIN